MGAYIFLQVGPDDNVFPVPALTAVGTLDGGVLSYVTRQATPILDHF